MEVKGAHMTENPARLLATGHQLDTERCRLRYPQCDDVRRLQSAFASPTFPSDVPLAQLKDREQVTQWIKGSQARWIRGEGYTWTVEDKSRGTIVGQVSLTRLPSGDGWALAFWTHPACWGQGYAPEAANRAIRCAFDELEASRVWAAAATWNQASQRVLKKLGMVHIGDSPAGYTIQGRSIPTVEFEITRRTWRKSSQLPSQTARPSGPKG
jgi:RimJ/RimL family protein N-acetyltransferase